MNILHKVTLRYLAINRTRTIVTIIGIILSVSMITAVTTLISSLQKYMLDNAIHVEGDWHGAFYDIDRKTAENIERDEKIHSVAFAENVGYANIGSSNEYKPYLFIMGADDLFIERLPIHLISGRMPESPDEIILPSHLASNGNVVYKTGDVLRLEIGDRYFNGSRLMQNNGYVHPDDVEESIENHPENSKGDAAPIAKGEELVIRETREYTVVGFYERPNFELYTAPGYTAITKTRPEGKTDSFAAYFKMNNPYETFDYVDSAGFRGTTNSDVLMFSGISRYNNFYVVLYSLAAILIGLIVFGSVSLIYNAFAISVSERTRQFGMLSSIGATKRQSRRMVLFEALVVSSIGIPVGILSGILGIGITIKFIGNKFSGFFGSQGLALGLYVTPASIAVACAIALITVLISAWIPSKRATKVSAIDAIRLSRDISVKPREVKTSALTYKLFGLEGMIAEKHFKRSKKKYRATVISLFMSTVLFISASSFCAYLTDAVTSTFQDSDYDVVFHYKPGNNEDVSFDKLKAIYHGLLSSASSVTSSSYSLISSAVCTIPVNLLSDDYVKFFESNGEAAEIEIHTVIYGIGDDVYLQYLARNGLNEKVYMDRDNPRGLGQALISDFAPSLQRFITIPVLNDSSVTLNCKWYAYEKLNKLTRKEQQELIESGDEKEYIVNTQLKFDIIDTDLAMGLNESRNYGIKIMYPMSIYLELFDVTMCDYYFQAKSPSKAYEELQNYLTENGMISSDNTLVNVYRMNEIERNLVTIIKVFSYGFIILISLIGLANMFNTISTNIMLRRGEFAMLKSVGMTRKGFRKMMNFECVLYGIKSLMGGIPAAFFVTWLIYRSITRGFDTTFYLPWASVAIAVCSVFAVVFATMIYSMRKINRDNPIDVLKNNI